MVKTYRIIGDNNEILETTDISEIKSVSLIGKIDLELEKEVISKRLIEIGLLLAKF